MTNVCEYLAGEGGLKEKGCDIQTRGGSEGGKEVLPGGGLVVARRAGLAKSCERGMEGVRLL